MTNAADPLARLEAWRGEDVERMYSVHSPDGFDPYWRLSIRGTSYPGLTLSAAVDAALGMSAASTPHRAEGV